MPNIYERCEECDTHYTNRDSLYIRVSDGSKSPKFIRIGFFCYTCKKPTIRTELLQKAITKAKEAGGYR